MVAEYLSPTVYWPSGCSGHCATLFRQVCGGLAGSTDEAIFWYSYCCGSMGIPSDFGISWTAKKLSEPLYASAGDTDAV